MDSEPSSAVERDLRIDFFRGVALIVVLVDHIEQMSGVSLFAEWTPRSLGVTDGADAFVFLSGYTFGLVYSRRINRKGFLFAFKKSVVRSFQIYLAYLLTLAAVLILGFIFRSTAPALQSWLSLDKPIGTHHILSGLLLGNQPYGFPILAFYVLMLPYATVLVWLLQRRPVLAWTISLGLYLLAQYLPGMNLPHVHNSGGWFFNPFAWQFLYFLAVVLGMKQLGAPQSRWLRASLSALAVAVVVVGLVGTKGHELWDSPLTQVVAESIGHWPGLTSKSTLGPLRVIHFLCLVWLVSRLCGKHSTWLARTPGKYVAIAGQRSLLVYSLGLFLAFASMPAFVVLGKSTAIVLLLHATAVLLSIFVAWLRSREIRGDAKFEEASQRMDEQFIR